ncbi:MAG: preprotein translocase subunit SecE [Lachnospiraceae bacterium]|jgi:preprotein translocase subunit SecE|nr:preprotein translocase subunit SecE [Lachnospiraceae bacterium]
MAETTNTAKTANTAKAPKPSFIKGLKAEFRKIVWPDQETVAKQSATVVVVTVLLGTVIALLDFAIKKGLDIILFLG